MISTSNNTTCSLLVFSDDWGRHPSSCQHLIRQLLPRYPVTWVNTIGMRTPQLDQATFQRAWEKLQCWSRQSNQLASLPENLQVANPKMWPWFTRKHDRQINSWLLSRHLHSTVGNQQNPIVAITTVPVVADLIGKLPVDRWVYYCVDDFSKWPGLDQTTLDHMERELVSKCDQIIAVSDTLQERLNSMGRDSELLTHGVDIDFWKTNGTSDSVPQLDDLSEPLVVFWGVVDQRMETEYIRQLAADMTHGTIALIGPEQDPDPQLMRIPRVKYLGPLPYESLPHVGAAAEVLIMPYRDIPVTQAIQPLKLKEYLAVDKPVVVRDLPSTRCWGNSLDLAHSAEEFSRLVRLRLAGGIPEHQRLARQSLQSESWSGKARQFEQWAIQT